MDTNIKAGGDVILMAAGFELTGDDAVLMAADFDLASGDLTAVSNGILIKVHRAGACAGPHCWVHNPSNHHMVDWQVRWRDDRHIAERLCPHGVGHPDPDDLDFNAVHGRDVSVHACGGCCAPGGDA